MEFIEGLLIFLSIIGIYAVSVFILKKKGILEKYNISFWGPALMWRTKRGRGWLKKVSRFTRFWNGFANAGIVFSFITMILMLYMFISLSWDLLQASPEQISQLPGLEFAVVIPIINPILPLEYFGYVIIALIVAIIVHEFSHGILSYVGKIKVKSLGILYLIIPLGAFCEPDEEELTKTSSKNRMKIFAAGAFMNIVVTGITMILFSLVIMSAVQPAADGISILHVIDESPAEQYHLQPGSIITYLNDTQITDTYDYLSVMQETQANQSINITYVLGEQQHSTTVVLADKYLFTNNMSYQGKGYLGVGNGFYKEYLAFLKNPFLSFPTGFVYYWGIPIFGYFEGYNPIVAPYTNSYVITGPLSLLPTDVFWMIANALYWIFWLNFAVAIFNVLPMVPLDGGYIFKDGLSLFVKRLWKKATEEKQDRLVKSITLTLSLLILFFIAFPFILKYASELLH